MLKEKNKILKIVVCLLSIFCLFSVVNSKNETIVYANEDYLFDEIIPGYTYEMVLHKDCSIDMNQLIDERTTSKHIDLEIDLNNYTLNIVNNVESPTLNLKIRNGTIMADYNDVLFDACGELYLSNVTFSVKCQTLFTVYSEMNLYGFAQSYKNVTVENCKFINCSFSGSHGGAFYFDGYSDGSINFINNRFYNCNSVGSLIYINDLWSSFRSDTRHVAFNMSGCKFYNCENANGCIYLGVPYIDIGDLNDVANNSIDSCTSSLYAGAIYDNGGYGLIKGFVFRNNKSNGIYGGAIYLTTNERTIDDCVFARNSATEEGYGGAIYCGYEADYITIQNCCFTENRASIGGAIYNRSNSNAIIDCLFAYNTAKENCFDIYSPTNVSNCHFYNLSKNVIFNDEWDEYFGYDGYVDDDCTVQNYDNLISFSGEGTVDNPFVIGDESDAFRLIVSSKLGLNTKFKGYRFVVTKDNLIWYEPIYNLVNNFEGIIDCSNKTIFIQGDESAIIKGDSAKYYIAENHDGITLHDLPSSVSYYVYNENTLNYEPITSDVSYLQNYASVYTLNSGVYFIDRDITYSERINISGNVTFVFNEGATLKAEKGIRLVSGNSLTLVNVTTDKNKAGKLVATSYFGDAGIGGSHGESNQYGEDCGILNDYGVTLEINADGVGIGGGRQGKILNPRAQLTYKGGNGGNIKICDSVVTITSTETGIGGGLCNAVIRTYENKFGDGGHGGNLTLINTDLEIDSNLIGIGGGCGWDDQIYNVYVNGSDG